MGLAIKAGQYSLAGIKEFNEDACGIRVPDGELLNTKGLALIVADGVSSSAAGREASTTCVQGFFSDYFSTPESWTVKTSAQKVLGAINRWLYGQGSQFTHTTQGMLTTATALVIKSTTAHVFHVGDSRLCRIRDHEFERLTRDHKNWVSKEKSYLSRAMGADINVEIDYKNFAVEVGDIYILMTDGVYEFLHTKNIIDVINQHLDNPDRAAREIVTKALENGSNDNVTCQVCIIEHLPNQDEEAFYKKLTELPFPPPLDSGMLLGGYKVLREIHASKRTQVYLALDTDSNTKVVLKTPSINFDDDAQFIDGFLHEEWAGRRINNPHVLKVLEPIQSRRFLYYVTEYIEGQTLRQWMHDNPNPDLNEVRTLLKQLITGIRAFQRQEMIHQDLKPDNIMIDTNSVLKIIDFGSVKIAGIQEISQPVEHGNLLGTLDYSAPEYFRGHSGTHQSDIYSVGVIIYQMLCAKLPYGSPLSTRKLHQYSYIPITRINPEIPDWINGALAKAVHFDTNKRYTSLSEFESDMTHPNPELVTSVSQPLLERNPVKFWQFISLILLITNLLLLYALLSDNLFR